MDISKLQPALHWLWVISPAQGPTHRLEIHTPRDALRMEDLSTDEEDRVHSEMRQYENKIENLMSEVGTLKNEVLNKRNMRYLLRLGFYWCGLSSVLCNTFKLLTGKTAGINACV